MSLKNQDIIDKLTLKEKIRFCSGASFWSTEHNEQLGIPEMFMTDGPHGVRMQKGSGEPDELYNSYPATCFPTASACASTWNRELIYRMGEAMGDEATALGTDLILGPGVNIKRNPLCGRNFEYYSEDPYLSGQMGASLIKGIQSTKRGACAKHFMGNSQETDRLICNDIMDERALREIYLSSFETIVKEAKPASIMASYNEAEGVSMTNNVRISKDILRKEWGFSGVLMSDWGAINDRVLSLKAGVDLEMPGSYGFYEKSVIKAIESGELLEATLDESVDRVITMIHQYTADKSEKGAFNVVGHNTLACTIEEEGAVLLKNKGALPLDPKEKIALVGGLAIYTRYQGSGSSHITATKETSILDAFRINYPECDYYEGYSGQDIQNDMLMELAIEGASKVEKTVIIAGLSDTYESEGYDRASMELPKAQVRLINEICKVCDEVIVVLIGGAPVEMDWEPQVNGILNMYLGGQAVGMAAYNLLYGRANPSGRLAETYPMHYEDVPSSHIFTKEPRQAFYDESIYVGYRYYEKTGKKVRFPFGYGLSYSIFDYTDIKVEGDGYNYTVMVTVTNIGNMDGSEVVELYVHDASGMKFRPYKELKGFEKIFLRAGESGMVTFSLDKRSFAFYSTEKKDWIVPAGGYDIMVGSTSIDIMLSYHIELEGQSIDESNIPQWYLKPEGRPDREQFEKLYGKKTPPYQYPQKGNYTTMTPLCDMQDSWFVRKFTKTACKIASKPFKYNTNKSALKMELEQIMTAPLKALYLQAHMKMPFWVIRMVVWFGNH